MELLQRKIGTNAGKGLVSSRLRLSSKACLAALILAAFVQVFSCTEKSSVNPVAIVGMDGVDWRIVRDLASKGKLPHFNRFLEGGVVSEMKTLRPMISPAIWTTVATGVLPERHGVTWFMVKDSRGKMIPVTAAQRRTKAIWNIATERGKSTDVVGWWASWPAEEIKGRMISDHMGFHIFSIQSDSVKTEIGNTYPEGLNRELAPMKVDPFDVPLSRIKRYMNISSTEYNVSVDMDALCKRPEYADCLYCKGESEIPFCHLNPLHHFLRALATLESFYGMSLHLLDRGQPGLFMVYFEWVDVVSHQYMRFAPPKADFVTDARYEKYKNVVEKTYIRQDEILGKLLEKLDENTNVIILSDHGFKIGAERPAKTGETRVKMAHLWHRQPAFMAMMGPDIRDGGKKIASRVQDITPTALALMGLPVAEDMAGGVLKNAIRPAFLNDNPIERIETYEEKTAKVAAGEKSLPESRISGRIKERLKALGYIGDVDDTGLEINRAQLLIQKGNFKEAEKALRTVLEKNPDNLGALSMLGDVYMQTERFEQAAKVYSRVDEISVSKSGAVNDAEMAEILAGWGMALFNAGKLDGAHEKCKRAIKRSGDSHMANFCLGRISEVKQKWDEAAGFYEKALKINPASAEAHNNLANCYVRKNMSRKALEHYRKAAKVNPAHVECHHNAGVIYMQMNKLEKARNEFETALEINPDLIPAMAKLGQVYMRLQEYDKAAELFNKLAVHKPNAPAPLVYKARARMARGNTEEAIDSLRRAHRLNPSFVNKALASDPLFKGIDRAEIR